MKNNQQLPKPIVTKEWLRDRLLAQDANVVLGRALVAIYRRQEPEEQSASTTIILNGRGFTAFDAKSGTLAAELFIKNGIVPANLFKGWTKIQANGYPRICRYVNQLNEIAIANKLKKDAEANSFGKKTIPSIFERGVIGLHPVVKSVQAENNYMHFIAR